MKKYWNLILILIVIAIIPTRSASAKTEEKSVFYYTDKTKDSYAGQSEIKIGKGTTFHVQDYYSTLKQVKKITFDPDITSLDDFVFVKFPDTEEVVLPDQLEDTQGAFYEKIIDGEKRYPLPKLKTIRIAAENSIYCVEDNVLYSKDITHIICYPSLKEDTVYHVPDSVVSKYCPINNDNLIVIDLGAGIKKFDLTKSCLPSFEKFEVNEKNATLTAKNGVLYSKDLSELITYPMGNTNSTFAIPESVKVIRANAFRNTIVSHVILPSDFEEYRKEDIKKMFDGSQITELEISDSKYYASNDGALYDMSKENLIYWPPAKSTEILKFPSTLKSLSFWDIPNLENMKQLLLPRDLEDLMTRPLFDSLCEVQLEDGNENFSICTGCLYDKNGRLLLIPPKTTQTSITIPKSCTNCDISGQPEIPSITNVIIGFNGKKFPYWLLPNLATFEIENGNTEAKVVDHVLYSKNMTTLIWYPQKKKSKSFTVPSTVTAMGRNAFHSQKYLTSLTLPKSLTIKSFNYQTWFYDCLKLKEIKVKSGNKSFASVDGVLFTKSMKKLLYYPAAKTSTSYTVPSKTNEVWFVSGNPYLKNLSFNKNLDNLYVDPDTICQFSNLQKVTVPKGCLNFYSKDNALYVHYEFDTMQRNGLVWYPMAKRSKSLHLTKDIAGVTCIKCLEKHPYLKEITSASEDYVVVDGKLVYTGDEYEPEE